jgi:hypothetical protein
MPVSTAMIRVTVPSTTCTPYPPSASARSAATGTVSTSSRWEAVNPTSTVAESRPATAFASSMATVTSTAVEAGSCSSAGLMTSSAFVILPRAVLPSGSVTVTAAPLRANRWSETSSSTVTTRAVPV